MAKGESYEQFVEKFKPKKTTDDCYTPQAVYHAVKNWAVKQYGLEGRRVVRPFYPGGDYVNFEYPENGVVIDNPPFSILSQICRFYMKNGIDFFLFAPTKTLFATARGRLNYVCTYADIIYENGADVATSFVTNLGDYKILGSRELSEIIESVQTNTAPLPKLEFPDVVISGARMSMLIKRSDDIKIKRAVFISGVQDKDIYGGGMLVSTKNGQMFREIKQRKIKQRKIKQRKIKQRKAEVYALTEKQSLIVALLNRAEANEE